MADENENENELDRADYPDATDAQFEQIQAGQLPGERKVQMVTMIIAVLALFFGLMGMVF